VIYRDLKPENVLLDIEGHVVLTDFGLAKEGVTDTSMTNSFCGSPAYLAPEMLKKQGHSHSVDWYILGVLLYEMLTGAPPFFSSNRDLMFQNIQKATLRFPKGISSAARDLIGKLVERDPVARLGSGVTGSEEVKRHSFFAGVDWEAVYRRELRPPLPIVAKVKTHSYNQERVFGSQDKPGETVAGWSFAEGNY
jgi:serine/threonine protein kinase